MLPEGRKKSQIAQKGAITDGGGMGSPEGEKLQENLIQNYTRKKGSLVKTSVLLTDCFHNLKNKDYHDDNDFILEH